MLSATLKKLIVGLFLTFATLQCSSGLSMASSVGSTAGCGHAWANGQDVTDTLDFDGLTRTSLIHVPIGYNPSAPTTLILNLPAATTSAQGEELVTGMSQLSDQKGFLVVYPNGTMGKDGKTLGWNVYSDGDPTYLGQNWRSVDDVGFLNALVQHLEQQFCVDTAHISIAGYSLGASMAYHMACVNTPWLSAIAPVATINPEAISSCHFGHPISLIAFNGESDIVASYYGWGITWTVPSSVAAFAEAVGCQKSGTTGFQQADVIQTVYGPCSANADVQLYSITDGGHTWPGGFPVFWLGYTTTAINASQLIYSFVSTHALQAGS